ncbi:MAG: hypothetical protein ACR9NN_19070 [Nostochopsis sp.]
MLLSINIDLDLWLEYACGLDSVGAAHRSIAIFCNHNILQSEVWKVS